MRIKRQSVRGGIKIGRKYTTSYIKGRNGKRYTTGRIKNNKYFSWLN